MGATTGAKPRIGHVRGPVEEPRTESSHFAVRARVVRVAPELTVTWTASTRLAAAVRPGPKATSGSEVLQAVDAVDPDPLEADEVEGAEDAEHDRYKTQKVTGCWAGFARMKGIGYSPIVATAQYPSAAVRYCRAVRYYVGREVCRQAEESSIAAAIPSGVTGSITPFSAMIPRMSRAGVTSKAGE